MLPEQSPDVIRIVRRWLAESDGVHLKFLSARFEDDWLYVVVKTVDESPLTSDHVYLMSQIEKGLRRQGYDDVILVPAIYDSLLDPVGSSA